MKKAIFFLLALILLSPASIHAREYHVSAIKGIDSNNGSPTKPFKAISAAVKVAFPGETITVHEGTYREWINPIRGKDYLS
jgi:alpha-L-arabinofuranosidase